MDGGRMSNRRTQLKAGGAAAGPGEGCDGDGGGGGGGGEEVRGAGQGAPSPRCQRPHPRQLSSAACSRVGATGPLQGGDRLGGSKPPMGSKAAQTNRFHTQPLVGQGRCESGHEAQVHAWSGNVDEPQLQPVRSTATNHLTSTHSITPLTPLNVYITTHSVTHSSYITNSFAIC